MKKKIWERRFERLTDLIGSKGSISSMSSKGWKYFQFRDAGYDFVLFYAFNTKHQTPNNKPQKPPKRL